MTYRVVVTGSRDHEDSVLIYGVLDSIWVDHPDMVLVHGAARGADAIADRWARMRGVPREPFEADWELGKMAGPIRNGRMVTAGADEVAAFPLPGSTGTWDCVEKAMEADIRVEVYPPTADIRPASGSTGRAPR